MISPGTTNDKGVPAGILLREKDGIQERVSYEEIYAQWVLCRWLSRQGVWVLDQVFTLPKETAMKLKEVLNEDRPSSKVP